MNNKLEDNLQVYVKNIELSNGNNLNNLNNKLLILSEFDISKEKYYTIDCKKILFEISHIDNQFKINENLVYKAFKKNLAMIELDKLNVDYVNNRNIWVEKLIQLNTEHNDSCKIISQKRNIILTLIAQLEHKK